MSGTPCNASRISSTAAGIRSKSRFVRNHLAFFISAVLVSPLVVSSVSWESLGAENNLTPPTTSQLEEANSQPLLHAWSQLEEQLQATQAAIEQNRQEAKEAAAQNAEALSRGLQSIQQALSAQRAQDLAVMQESNKVMLIVAGTFAALGFLTLLIMTCFQWRLSKCLAEISAALPALGFDPGSAADAPALAGQSNLDLLGAIEQTPERSHELEQGPHSGLKQRGGADMSIGNPLFHQPGALVRRRRFRAVSVAVIVGLICAAGLALLLYVVASRKLGFG